MFNTKNRYFRAPASLLGAGMLFLCSGAAAQAIDGEEFECILEPSQEVELSTAVYGVLSSVLVERGDSVRSGQLLASLVSGAERASVDLAKANLEFVKRKHARVSELFEKSMIASFEMDEVETEMLIAELQVDQAEEQLKLREVRSPIDGVVVERDKDPGEYVETESMLTIVQLNPLNVEVVLPAGYFGVVSEDMSGAVTTLGPIEEIYQAEVALIDQIIDAASDTIRVRLTLDNPEYAIPAGLNCLVTFAQ